MFLPVLSFFLGILAVQQWQVLPGTLFLGVVLIFAVLSVIFKHRRIAFFLVGFLFASTHAHYYLSNQLSPDLQAKEILVQGDIIGLPEHNARRVRFDFKVTQASVPLPGRLRLSWYYPKQEVTAGQSWQFFVKLKQPHGSLNPGGFDYEKWLFARHVGATGYIRQADQAKLLASKSFWFSLDVMRQTLVDLLDRQAIDTESLALIKALTLGDKSAISTEQWSVLSKSGTSHLMAISGLHIGLVAGMVYFLAFQCWLRFPSSLYAAPQVAAIFSSFAALFYAALAGFSIPTQRALIMLGVLMLSILLRRHVAVLNVFALAILLVLLIDPFAVLSAGFYLSFLAVFVIVYVLSARLGRQHRFFSSLKIHAVIGLSLFPILLLFFQSVSMVAPLANIIAVPVVSFIVVPIALVAVILLQIAPELAAWLLQFVDIVFQVLWTVLQTLAALPVANIIRPQPALWQVIIAMLGILLLLAPRGIPSRYLGILFMLPLFLVHSQRPAVGDMTLTLLDVGQGLSVVVETAEHTLVFDAGARFSDKFDMGKNVIIPFLHYQNIDTLDKLIISHADNDHIGGAEFILDSMPVLHVLSSVPKALTAYDATHCLAGYSWQWDQVNFQFLSPPVEGFDSENDNSCVLKIETASGSVLLTGDIEWDAERYLSQNAANKLSAQVLIAAHHGSKTSSSALFLEKVKPEIILIPAGKPNRFGFPHAQVLKRYQDIAANYLITGETGAITVKFYAGQVDVETYRDKHSYYWNR